MLPNSPMRKPIKRKKRTESEFARIHGSRARVAFISSLPCAACGRGTPPPGNHNAHIKTGGIGRKADSTDIIPLCADCHGAQHRMGWDAIGLEEMAERERRAAIVERAWQAKNSVTWITEHRWYTM